MSNPKLKESVYIVDNIKEAYELMHLELGPDAQLTERKKIRQEGSFSFFKKRKIQATATVDYEAYVRQNKLRGIVTDKQEEVKKPKSKAELEYNPNGVDFGPSTKTKTTSTSSNEISPDVVKILEKVIREKQTTDTQIQETKERSSLNPYDKVKQKTEKASSGVKQSNSDDNHEQEIKQQPNLDVERMNQELEEMKNNMKMLLAMNQQQKVAETTVSVTQKEEFPSWLKDYQFSDLVLKGLKKYLDEKEIAQSQLTKFHLEEFVKRTLNEKLRVSSLDEAETVVLVGPTGVGKTTTLSKIATRYYKRTEKAVGFITFDVFRIGAVQQLEIYAEILESDIKVVYDPQQLSDAIVELRNGSDECEAHELILIDSIGRSYRDEESIQQLKQFVEASKTNQIVLVLNATTNYREIKRIMEKYKDLNYSQIILTKLDESERSENILNICYEFTHPLSFVCTGQMVVDDIEVPTVESLTKYILEGVHHD